MRIGCRSLRVIVIPSLDDVLFICHFLCRYSDPDAVRLAADGPLPAKIGPAERTAILEADVQLLLLLLADKSNGEESE